MVSRRKILSRSRDDLNLEAPPQEEEEDIWYNKDKLYKVRTSASKSSIRRFVITEKAPTRAFS